MNTVKFIFDMSVISVVSNFFHVSKFFHKYFGLSEAFHWPFYKDGKLYQSFGGESGRIDRRRHYQSECKCQWGRYYEQIAFHREYYSSEKSRGLVMFFHSDNLLRKPTFQVLTNQRHPLLDMVFNGIKSGQKKWFTLYKEENQNPDGKHPSSEGWCTLPPLPFEYHELDPFIKTSIMKTHHGFVSKFIVYSRIRKSRLPLSPPLSNSCLFFL